MQTTSADSLDARVKDIVVRLLAERAPDNLANDASLATVGLSSLDMVNLMIQIESDFNITIPPRLVTPKSFHSVEAIVRLIQTVDIAA